MMNELFFSTNCLSQLTSWEALKVYNKIGLRNVELGSSMDYMDDPSAEIRKYDFNFLVHNYFPPPKSHFILNLSSPNKMILNRTIKFAKDSIDFCVKIESPLYSIHAGFINDPVDVNRFESFQFQLPRHGQDKVKAIQRMKTSLKELANYASDRDILLAIENNVTTRSLEKYVLVAKPNEIIDFFKDVSESNIGLLLDIGHLNTAAHLLGAKLRTCIDQIMAEDIDIYEFHIHTNNGEKDEHRLPEKDDWIWKFIGCHRSIPATIEAIGLTPSRVRAFL